jgi:prolyl oligopeptidase
LRFGLPLALATCTVAAALGATPVKAPPPTRTAPAVDVLHGVRVVDPYRWLEDGLSPEVKAWSDRQNLRARAYLDAIPGRDGLKTELTALIKATSPSISSLKARHGQVFALYNDPAQQQPQLVVMHGDVDPANRKVLLDPNTLSAHGSVAIDWFEPSPDGSKAAVSLSMNGSEDGSLHLYDVDTGREIEPIIPRVQFPTAGGSLAWAKDSQAFWYTRFPGEDAPEADRHFFQQVYFHRLGAAWTDDALVLATKDGLPRTAEVYLDNRYGGPDALASVQLGDGGQWRHFVLKAGGGFVQVADYTDHIAAASLGPDGALYGVSRLDAPNGKIIKLAAPYAGGFAKGVAIVPEGRMAIPTDDRTEALTLTHDHLFVREIDGGPSTVRMFDLAGGRAADLPIPAIADIPQIEPLANGDVLYAVNSFLRPPYYMRWAADTGSSSETKLAVRSPVDYGDTEVVREFATSKDGTKVPLNIIRRKGTRLDGNNPVLIYGYGGYGVSVTPFFLGAWRRLWLDAGGVYVVANIRGGGEYGERWHTEGNLTHKQNVFDDFFAAGRWLIDNGYTRSEKLALQGGSNGGLLMGATLTQHPELARAVISSVGIYDMIRVELDPNGSFNITEFGTVKDLAQFQALYAYSPYHHVQASDHYPAVLLMPGPMTAGSIRSTAVSSPRRSRQPVAAVRSCCARAPPPATASAHRWTSELANRLTS